MEEMQQITLDQWLAWKEEIREKLRETAGNFVHIGFRLKQIRDSGMLDGAADIFEFALNEYGLSKSSTSRFIAINEKFSEGGNSLELRAEYRAIGSSKLAEMLTLTDAECRLITERTTVREIRELKNFSRQQAPESGEAGTGEEKALTPLQKCLVDYFGDKREMLNAVMEEAYDNDNPKRAAEIMNPSGYGTHKKGICFMFMYDFNTGVKAKILTEQEPRTMSWNDVFHELYEIFGDIFSTGEKDVYKAYYGSQEKAPDKMPEKKPEEAADAKPTISVSETGETAENQITENSEENPVATSQQEQKEEKPDEETCGEAEEQESDGEPEIGVCEMEETTENQNTEETAENQNTEGSEENPVATSQQEEPEDVIVRRQREKNERAKIWEQIETEEDVLNIFVLQYNQKAAAAGEIPLEILRKVYKSAVELAAGLKRLKLDAERGEQDVKEENPGSRQACTKRLEM